MSTHIYTGKAKVKIQRSIEFIQRELKDLGVPMFSTAYKVTFQNALEFSEIATKAELRRYIEEYLELLPNHYFN